jgi:transcriptional regulator NrdR family protein
MGGDKYEKGCNCINCRLGRIEEAVLDEHSAKRPVDRRAVERAVTDALDGMGDYHTNQTMAQKITDSVMEVLG